MAPAHGHGAFAGGRRAVLLTHPLPKVLFFGGKGGVGKTTLAAAMAAGHAAAGRRTLLISTDPAHSLEDLLGGDLGDGEKEVAPDLWVRELDPERARDNYLATVKENIRQFAAPEFIQEAERQVDLTGQHPGVMESALFESLCRQLDDASAWDQLVIDTAPTGHTLHLLTLPESMQVWTSALLAQQSGTPRGNRPLEDDPRSRARAILEKRRALFQRSRQQLQDAGQTGFLLVVNDDRLSVSEGVRARQTLDRAGVSIPALLVNRAARPADTVARAMASSFPGLAVHPLPAFDPPPQQLRGLEQVTQALSQSGLLPSQQEPTQ